MMCRQILFVFLAGCPSLAWAEEETKRRIPEIEWWGHALFWFGAIIIMALVSRVIFREMLGARRTLKRLNTEIGYQFVEFDIDHIKQWVALCLPHVWNGWAGRDMSGLTDFATSQFIAEQTAEISALAAKGHVHEAHFMRSLRVHPLGLFQEGEGPAPEGVCLLLRVEQKCVDFVQDARNKLVKGRRNVRQVHHYWLLRHNGHAWRLHRVWEADDDLSILSESPELPPLDTWRRPPIVSESD